MKDRSIKRTIISYSVTFVLAAAVTLMILFYKDAFQIESLRTLYGVLSDAFFVPGVILMGFGIMVHIAEGGFLDGISYSLRRAALSFIPGGRIKKEETYREYKERKNDTRKKTEVISMYVVGGAFILVSIVFIILYSSISA